MCQKAQSISVFDIYTAFFKGLEMTKTSLEATVAF